MWTLASKNVDENEWQEPGSRHGDPTVVVIGAGPAGLTAAYVLATRYGIAATVLEADDVVGGISRTVERDGWRFDLGGHRFFTKVAEVEALWQEILPGEEFMVRPRMSRIFYRGKYYDYPLKPANALRNLGPVEAARCVGSYAWARLRPPKDQTTLEGWIVARFGRRLYEHLFQTYNEKLWGVPVSRLPADFAAQRIKNLSLFNAVTSALRPPKAGQTAITSLIEEFRYPMYGPGMMWQRCAQLSEAAGAKVTTGARVVEIRHDHGRVTSVVARHGDGTISEHPADEVVSSMPISELITSLNPPADPDVVAAATDLRYRDFLTVAVVVAAEAGFPDNWIYIHAPEVKVGRIQNFGSWSPHMVKDAKTCLGLEYFVFEGDDTWNTPDHQLIEQAKAELGVLGLADPGTVEAGWVVRVPKAYPFYDERYKANVARIVDWLDEHAANVHPVGRNGMHRYNNQDHSMLTAMLTADNIATGTSHDVWNVNVEAEYHEQTAARPATAPGAHGTGRDAPVIRRDTYNTDHPINQPKTAHRT